MIDGPYKRMRIGMAILPRSEKDPTGIEPKVHQCERDLSERFDRIKRGYLALISGLRGRVLSNNSSMVVNEFYAYEIDENLLSGIYAGLDALVEEAIMETIAGNSWFFERYLEPALRTGAIAAYLNIAAQVPEYQLLIPTVSEFLISERYRLRVALVKSRQFEFMAGLAGETRNDLARVLADGISRGLNPRQVAKAITEQIDIEKRRANRIAQTEITMALRRARWEESDYAEEKTQIRMMELHLSALKPTTRVGHAARHGKLYTRDQVRKWYSEGANAINCYCSQSSVAVDEDGNPISTAMARRMQKLVNRGDEFVAEHSKEKES